MYLQLVEAATTVTRRRNGVIDRATSVAASEAAAWVIVGVGLVLRLIRYASNRSLWGDEAMLALNITNRSPRELLETLDFTQAAPPAFLLAEKLAVMTFGPTEYALRLVPLLAALAALILFRSISRRLLSPFAALLALALFAVAEPLVYYSSEVKQYSVDVLAVLLVLYVASPILEGERIGTARAIALAAAGSILVWFAHPVVFALAGIGVALTAARARSPQRRLVIPLLVCAVWLAAFLTLYTSTVGRTADVRSALGLVDRQGSAAPSQFLRDAWHAFADPGPFPKSMTALVAVLAAVGIISMAHRRPWHTVAIGATFGATALASLVDRYPLHGRFLLFAVPLLVIVVAAGVEALWSQHTRALRLLAAAVLAVVLLYPAGIGASNAIDPPQHEELREVLEPIEAGWHTGDTLYVSGVAQFALRYYVECRECGALDDGPLRDLILMNRTRGRTSLVSDHPRLIVGNIYNLAPYETYLSDLERLRGRERVWLLFSSDWDASFTTLVLDCFGRRLETFEAVRATAYLYDLHRIENDDCFAP